LRHQLGAVSQRFPRLGFSTMPLTARLSRCLLLPSLFAAAAQRVLDTHVHITNTSLLSYPWANASLGVPCPAAPPALCNWTLVDYGAATVSRPATKVVFVEVAVAAAEWLAEATWVQSLAAAPAGAALGAIVAQPPPGFGVPGADAAKVAAGLDALAALPLARGVRGSAINFADPAALPTAIAHTRLLAARRLSLDVITAVQAPGAAAGILALARAVPEATLVLDHVGSPDVAADLAPWAAAMAALGAQPNIFVKVGGIFQYFKSTQAVPTLAQVAPIATAAIRAFGFGRAAHECNWFFVNWLNPARLDMCELWHTYLEAVLDGMNATQDERDQLYWRAGARAYRVAM